MKIIRLLLVIAFIYSSGIVLSQSPQKFNYQAVARNSAGNVINNQPVGMEISIHQGTASGPVVYSETHLPTTSNIGLINLSIGSGTVTSGTFSSINWSAGPFFIEIGMDVAGGSSYISMGTNNY